MDSASPGYFDPPGRRTAVIFIDPPGFGERILRIITNTWCFIRALHRRWLNDHELAIRAAKRDVAPPFYHEVYGERWASDRRVRQLAAFVIDRGDQCRRAGE